MELAYIELCCAVMGVPDCDYELLCLSIDLDVLEGVEVLIIFDLLVDVGLDVDKLRLLLLVGNSADSHSWMDGKKHQNIYFK